MSSGFDDRYEDEPYDDRDEDRRRPRRRGSSLDEIKARVKSPAIGLLVTGIVSLLFSLMGIVNVFTMDRQLADVEQQWDNDPNLTPQQKQDMKKMLNQYKGIIKTVVPVTVGLGIFTSLITIFGSIKMMNLSGRGMAMTGSVLSMLPVFSGCCCLGLPFGIWALMTLSKPEVKAAFAEQAYGGPPDQDY